MERRKISGSFRDYRVKFITVYITTAVRLELDFKFILVIIITSKVSDNLLRSDRRDLSLSLISEQEELSLEGLAASVGNGKFKLMQFWQNQLPELGLV